MTSARTRKPFTTGERSSNTRPAHILPVIIFSQFAGTSLWFSGNAVAADLQRDWALAEQSLGYITSSVQLGFIVGTLGFAILTVADRFSPRRVFFCCSLAGAGANLAIMFAPEQLSWLLALRFATGLFLAGVYPAGMKIAAGWFEKGLGRALGYLVGALVLGTAFPHLLRALGADLPWGQVMIAVSILAVCGGWMMFRLVPDGPYLPPAAAFNPRALVIIFRSPAYRASAFGYFGHMWELYALWAFLPIWLVAYRENTGASLDLSLWAFLIIGAGSIGCAVGGLFSGRLGSAPVAAVQLLVSGVCCVLSPLVFNAPLPLVLSFLLVWGVTVAGDSPQFSALNAGNAPREFVGSALTIATCIGFLITVFSIELINRTLPLLGTQFIFWLLIPGPVLGLLALRPLYRRT